MDAVVIDKITSVLMPSLSNHEAQLHNPPPSIRAERNIRLPVWPESHAHVLEVP
jgi:hypothetical protein